MDVENPLAGTPYADEFAGITRNLEAKMGDDFTRYLERFSEVTGIKDRTIGLEAVGDSGYILKWRKGEAPSKEGAPRRRRRLTPEKYDRVVEYCDKRGTPALLEEFASIPRNLQATMNRDLRFYLDRFAEITAGWHGRPVSDTTIGRDAVGDPSFVHKFRERTRELTPASYDRTVAYLDGYILENWQQFA